MSSRRSSVAPHHPELRKTSAKDLRSNLSSLTASTQRKSAQNGKQSARSLGQEEHASGAAMPKRLGSTAPQNQLEPNSIKNRRLLAELLQYSSTRKGDDDDNDDDDEKKGMETEKKNISMWKQLVHIKDRLEKLEVNEDSASPKGRIADISVHPFPPEPCLHMTVHQRRLQDALEEFKRSQPSAMTRTMSVMVAETIYMNQQMWQSIPCDLDAKTLVALQKSSDAQVKALTMTLLQLRRQSSSSMPSQNVIAITPPSPTSMSEQQQQRKGWMPPVSECGSSSMISHPRRRILKTDGGSSHGLLDYPDFNNRGAQIAPAMASARYYEPQ